MINADSASYAAGLTRSLPLERSSLRIVDVFIMSVPFKEVLFPFAMKMILLQIREGSNVKRLI